MSKTLVADPAAQPMARGVVLVLLAGAWLSLNGLVVRNIAVADDWQTVFYRSASAALGLLVLLAVRDRRGVIASFRSSGLPGLFAGAAVSVAMITFILAVNAVSVANALFLLAGAPFLTALLGRVLLREPVGLTTWLAMSGAFVGVAIMVWHGISAGNWFGNLMGLLTALSFAVFAVSLRFGRRVDMLPSVCLAGGISAVAAAIVLVMDGTGFLVPVTDFGLCVLLGFIMTSTLAAYAIGARSVPSAILTLLAQTEVLLGPVWVWLFLGEVPSSPTLIGGAVLMAAIGGQAVAGMLRR